MPTYRVVYGDEDNRVTEEFRDVVLEREDGWIVFFRGDDAILRVQEAHVQSLDQVRGESVQDDDITFVLIDVPRQAA